MNGELFRLASLSERWASLKAAFPKVFRSDEAVFDAKSTTNRYCLLDLLRFLACAMVILWHYQHFYYVRPAVFAPEWNCSGQPFFSALSFGYKQGHFGVQLFWTLSGFVFFALFSRRINEGTLTARRFAVDRFSRLYPLHFLSLFAVAALTRVLRHLTGSDGIYPCNDLYHFVLNLFFVPCILPNRGYSFNCPVWSVSLELVAYCVFFVFAKFRRPTVFKVWAIALACLFWRPWPVGFPYGIHVDQCLFCFFSGGGVFLLLRAWSRHLDGRLAYLLLVAAALALGLWFRNRYVWIPFAVLLFSFPFRIPGRLGAVCTHLGNLTYSVYMVHIPLQLTLMAAAKLVLGRHTAEIASSPKFFFFYLAVLWVVAAATYRLFELPAKNRIRALLS
ncbi:MAG: acyltransferase [Kiritimatiellae bacterium]|nr:acyltransferase [Kiritimatiellia bacterium]